ncbi:DUF4249 domain-containing protein [Porphyromonas asaccharolytica]|uniref:DUF4249 domain-containing protein n=1 Tax=Porphyromonas asaccharolytica TaxID=28123 RepID=UPI00248D5DFB|nr:DUF4249 domain-containing protein [Porphyromonas asaccharolytica]
MRPIQYIQLASSALLITLLAACRTTVPLDLGDNTPRIVINAVATEQQGIDISLSESKPTGVAAPSTNVYYPYYHPDCPYRMTLKVNDQLVPLSEVTQYKPQMGDRIAISVEKSGLKAASAVTTVPAQPTIGAVEVKTLDKNRRTTWVSNASNVRLQKGQYLELQNYELSIPLQGITKDSYYRIIVERQAVMRGEGIKPEEYRWSQEQMLDPSLAKFSSGDLIFESANAYPMNLLAGSNVSTSDYTLRTTLSFATRVCNADGSTDEAQTTSDVSDYVALRVTVYAITSDLYHYWQTVTSDRYNSMSETGLTEPILIYNNIQDGLGILGSMAAAQRQDLKIVTH